ncbi:MAG: PAS domain S-box protein [Desulfamplus sp.]|nr:PAS domain S-box protein [Desulfamplus sp.]
MTANGNDAELFILKQAVDNAGEAFVTINKNSTVLFFNKAAEKVFGYSQEEVVGKNLVNILGPDCREGHERGVDKFVQTGQGKLIGHATEFNAMRKNGETFPAEICFSVTSVQNEIYFTGIIRDLTEAKELQDKLVKSERLAALGQMTAEITHEIKNPLMIIGGFARRLQKKEENKESAKKLDIIVNEVSRLENLLRGLKYTFTPQTLILQRINLCQVLNEVQELLADECKERGIELDLYLNNICILIDADRDKLKQVIINLVNNSMEAMKDGGKLSITTRFVDNTAEVAIHDSGSGIPQEMKEKIFDPFFTTKQDGTGLGLCVSKKIIESHKGSSFSIESKEGVGTIARLALTRVHTE